MTLILALPYNGGVALFGDRRESHSSFHNKDGVDKLYCINGSIIAGVGRSVPIEHIIHFTRKRVEQVENPDIVYTLTNEYGDWNRRFGFRSSYLNTSPSFVIVTPESDIYCLDEGGCEPFRKNFLTLGRSEDFANYIINTVYSSRVDLSLELVKNIAGFTYCFVNKFDESVSSFGNEGVTYCTTTDPTPVNLELPSDRYNGFELKLDGSIRELLSNFGDCVGLYKESKLLGEEDEL